ncbi:uncharacterized protein BO96DRAFT_62877 [Aspergillus niger CBS 101883]|uniref:uncharacterized protein n=1 Tax=Aspergillus lacticoffeatus (strain CBS 101883) TaxID=1450533 RepID=UPI000D8049BA|nr:uncharacterized protein BO96DRAFT_62877 [Aspergillus niger CBS 101883]PYH56136.1 hypothetical protein BO96DRAFT_62877 [Aspergillus niger CBS 101883]
MKSAVGVKSEENGPPRETSDDRISTVKIAGHRDAASRPLGQCRVIRPWNHHLTACARATSSRNELQLHPRPIRDFSPVEPIGRGGDGGIHRRSDRGLHELQLYCLACRSLSVRSAMEKTLRLESVCHLIPTSHASE